MELGEIETLLNDHPGVRESVVIAKEMANWDKRLVAYVVPRNGQSPTRQQLRQYAQERLPEYMVPAQFVFMSEFPQTPNKKIDRRALPAPQVDVGEPDTAFEAPATEVEIQVAELWTELFGVQRVGLRDNFFESGGNSLLAMQFIVRVHDRLGVELPLKNLLEHSTVAELAEDIEALSRSATVKSPGPRIML